MNPTPSVRQRPRERVRQYIVQQLAQPGFGERLPTMRDLAAHLGVSLATVQNVYRALKAEGVIATRAGGGTSLVQSEPAEEASARPASRRRKIYFNHIAAEPGMQTLILGQYYGMLLQSAMQHNLLFDFSVLDARQSEVEQVRALFHSGELDGMIIFPFVPCQPLVAVCDELGIPYASIHPSNPHTQANFVSPDFFMSGYRMGEAFATAGRSEVAFLTLNPLMKSSTAWAFAAGLQNGLLEKGGRAVVEYMRIPRGEAKGSVIKEWFKARRKRLPDAIFCHRGTLVDPVMETLEAMKVAVPEGAAILSGLDTTADAIARHRITHVTFPFEAVSVAALDLLGRRIALGGVALPGILVPQAFAGGGSTLPAENRVLGI